MHLASPSERTEKNAKGPRRIALRRKSTKKEHLAQTPETRSNLKGTSLIADTCTKPQVLLHSHSSHNGETLTLIYLNFETYYYVISQADATSASHRSGKRTT